MTTTEQTSTSTDTHGVLLTDVAATKVKSLLEQEGREAGLHDRQPECGQLLRLRRQLQLIRPA